MYRISILMACLALSACVSPRSACISDANRDFKIVNALLAETEATVARGYGVRHTQRATIIVEPCLTRGRKTRWCERSVPIRERQVFAVDLQAERRKLSDLRKKRSELLARSTKAVEQCKVSFPKA